MALYGQNADHSYVLSKDGSAAFRFQYQWRSASDGSPAPLYVDEIDSDQETVLSSNVYWLNGAIGGGPPIVTPVYPLSYNWQTDGPYFQMRRAPHPDTANPGDTYAGTLLNSRAMVGVLAAESQPPPPPGGGPGVGDTPVQQVILNSDIGAAVKLRNLWLSHVVLHPFVTPPAPVDLGMNYIEPDDWFTPSFTGSGQEALSTGWADAGAFDPVLHPNLLNWMLANIPGAVPLATRADGAAIPNERQLVRAPFVCPPFDVAFHAVITIFARGRLLVVKVNGQDTGLGIASEPNSAGTIMSGEIDPVLLNVDGDNLLAIEYQNLPTGVVASAAQFIAYQIVVTT